MSITQLASGVAPFERFLQSILHSMVMILLAFYVFYKGYRAVSYNFFFRDAYVRMEIAFIVFYTYVLVYDVICYDGLQRIIHFIENDYNKVTIIFMCFEWIVLFLNIVLRIFLVAKIRGWHLVDADQDTETNTQTES